MGLASAWIANYLADVLPETRKLSQPKCLHCGSHYSWQDYLLLRRCKQCNSPRRIRAWLVIILSVILNIYFWTAPPARIGFWLGWVVLAYFTTVFVIDLEHRLILHPTSVFGAALGLLVGYLRHGLVTTLLGGLLGFVIVYAFYLLGVLFTKMRARRLQAQGLEADDEDAFGAGDVILATILGFMLGVTLIWFGILLGVLFGGVISGLIMLALFLTRRYRDNAWMIFIPFGPFFIVSAFLMIYLPKVAAYFTFQN
jgi:leader peptidase (prepilin peptidase)/N-methyltransferase